jgi:hypothetical protein
MSRAIAKLKHKLATAQGMYEAERYRRERVEGKLDRARAELSRLAEEVLAQEMGAEAELLASEPCAAETWSWDHYRSAQVDPYWIRCTRQGLHAEHEDSNTGLTWTTP